MCALAYHTITQLATLSLGLTYYAVWMHDTCYSISMHSSVEGSLALDNDLAHQRAALAANMHRALLTAALAHVQHPLQESYFVFTPVR